LQDATKERSFVTPEPRGGDLSMSRMLRRLLADETGQDLVEYALLAALITIVSVTALRILGEGLPKVFQDIWQVLQNP
jgi:Flp pilus assembly pilin Flp